MNTRLAFLLIAFLSSSIFAQEATRQTGEPVLSDGQRALGMLKTLVGDWTTKTKDEHTVGDVAVSYKLIGGGSTVVETLFPGSPHEMISMYHLDGKKLVMTHYCAMGNQPRMRGEFDQKNKKLVHMKFAGGTNFDPKKDGHIHEARLHFLGNGRFKSEWVFFDNGKADHTKVFDLVRRKKRATKSQ